MNNIYVINYTLFASRHSAFSDDAISWPRDSIHLDFLSHNNNYARRHSPTAFLINIFFFFSFTAYIIIYYIHNVMRCTIILYILYIYKYIHVLSVHESFANNWYVIRTNTHTRIHIISYILYIYTHNIIILYAYILYIIIVVLLNDNYTINTPRWCARKDNALLPEVVLYILTTTEKRWWWWLYRAVCYNNICIHNSIMMYNTIYI